jgi:hypothetical protein
MPCRLMSVLSHIASECTYCLLCQLASSECGGPKKLHYIRRNHNLASLVVTTDEISISSCHLMKVLVVKSTIAHTELRFWVCNLSVAPLQGAYK